MRSFAMLAVAAMLAAPGIAQTPSSQPPTETQSSAAKNSDSAPARFEAADVHFAPPVRSPSYRGAFLHGDRYILRQATMSNLIATAYKLKVGGGPSWLDWDRYEIEAEVPPGTTSETARLMLQNLLAERFKLVVHPGDVSAPAYLLTVDNGKPKLKPSTSTNEGSCESKPAASQEPGAAPLIAIECRGITMDSLGKTLIDRGGIYLSSGVPVIDATGLKGTYDFTLEWTPHDLQGKGGFPGISLFEALKQQLGLKLETKDSLRPGVLVDSVNEEPTANSPDLAKVMPPLPPPKFEVAVVRRSDPGKPLSGRTTGDEINFPNNSLRWLIDFAWDLNFNQDDIVGAPEWLATDHYDIHAKLSTANDLESATGGSVTRDWDNLRPMLRDLLIERFQMKVKMEDRVVDAYTLVAENPKLTRGEPSDRASCKSGPGPDGNDPRLKNPALTSVMTCTNVTMDQFAEQLHRTAPGYFHFPVKDATGLKGGWNLTIAWSIATYFKDEINPASAESSASAEPASAVPNGAISLYDALRKQLGLKAVKEKRPEPVLVIEQISRQPTEN